MTYSIFNAQGENVEGETFETAEQAKAFMDGTEWVSEYGPVHVGINCQTHDEHEQGNCRYCKAQQPITMAEALHHFNALPVEHQTRIMMARTRIARCQQCPVEWPLARKVGVADLCNGGIAS